MEVDLVGTPWVVDVGIDWDTPILDRGTRLEKLHLHYLDYTQDLDPQDWTRLMLDWIRRVPPYSRDSWRHSWNSFATSIRVVSWIDTLTLQGARIPESDRGAIEQSLAAQLRFLLANLELDIGGNHLMKNIRALVRAASYFAGPESRRWTVAAVGCLGVELDRQVLPDGMHFELSPSYHIQVMEDMIDMHRSLRSLEADVDMPSSVARVRERIGECLSRMSQPLQRFTHPDGMPSHFADGGLHMAAAPDDLFIALEREGIVTRDSPRRVCGTWRLSHGGYVGCGSKEESIIVDCGPVGARELPAHGHGDALAVEWSVSGERVLIDQGVFDYHSGRKRSIARATASHNTVTVEDHDQSEFWSAFRVGHRAQVTVADWRPGPDGFVLEASHDGYRRLDGSPMHMRRIEFRCGHLQVWDRVDGTGAQVARARLLLAPAVQVRFMEPHPDGMFQAELELPRHAAALPAMQLRLVSSVPVRLEQAVYWPDLGVEVTTTRLVLDLGTVPCDARWSIRLA
jgi:uncharacterized heparinase superfamily protein